MAMNGNTLGTAIANAINGLSQSQKENITTVWQTVAAQIVSHLQSNAVVTVTVTTAGSATNQSGGGTGTIS